MKIIKQCVDEPDLKWGGLQVVGTLGSFYVAVGKPKTPRWLSNSSVLLAATGSSLLEGSLDSLDGLPNDAVSESR